ncbi:MAG: hypothetical protein QW165_00085 [Candidatus Woesearchaeota archaeon]
MKWQILLLIMFLIACAKPAIEQVKEPVAKGEEIDMAIATKLGKPVKCVLDQKGQTVTIYMKGSKMRMDTMPADAHGIYTQDVMYTWKGDQGMMMRMDDVKRMSAQAGQEYRPKTQEEIVASAQQSNVKCEAAMIDESIFVPPSNIQFQDLSDMMKQAEAAVKGLQK